MSRRVLVVDDEPALLDAVGYALRSDGFEVTTAEDGEEAMGGTLHLQSQPGVGTTVEMKLPGAEIVER